MLESTRDLSSIPAHGAVSLRLPDELLVAVLQVDEVGGGDLRRMADFRRASRVEKVSVAASEADWSKRIREMQYADYEDHTTGS